MKVALTQAVDWYVRLHDRHASDAQREQLQRILRNARAAARIANQLLADATISNRLELAPRSAYVMAGSARTDWEHSIPDAIMRRVSITFRSMRRGRSRH